MLVRNVCFINLRCIIIFVKNFRAFSMRKNIFTTEKTNYDSTYVYVVMDCYCPHLMRNYVCPSLHWSEDNAPDLASSLVEYGLVSEEDREKVVELINEKLHTMNSLLSPDNNNSFAETWLPIIKIIFGTFCVCMFMCVRSFLFHLLCVLDVVYGQCSACYHCTCHGLRCGAIWTSYFVRFVDKDEVHRILTTYSVYV